MTNRAALEAGAAAYHSRGETFGWMDFNDAPTDGTVIEVKCTYGVAPWYGLFLWDGERWQDARQPHGGIKGGEHFKWRPFNGDVKAYVDPTGGMQDTTEYWRGAAAAKYGLPVDHFEAQAEANARRLKAQHGRKPWWRRLFGGGP